MATVLKQRQEAGTNLAITQRGQRRTIAEAPAGYMLTDIGRHAGSNIPTPFVSIRPSDTAFIT